MFAKLPAKLIKFTANGKVKMTTVVDGAFYNILLTPSQAETIISNLKEVLKEIDERK